MNENYWVYILSNWQNTVFYVGITNNLTRRLFEHRTKQVAGFTNKYNINKLLFCQTFSNPTEAIAAEKKIKGWRRSKKLDLIRTQNPGMVELVNIYKDPSTSSG